MNVETATKTYSSFDLNWVNVARVIRRCGVVGWLRRLAKFARYEFNGARIKLRRHFVLVVENF